MPLDEALRKLAFARLQAGELPISATFELRGPSNPADYTHGDPKSKHYGWCALCGVEDWPPSDWVRLVINKDAKDPELHETCFYALRDAASELSGNDTPYVAVDPDVRLR